MEKFTFEYIKSYIEEKGCLLLSDEYKNVFANLLVRGICGHEYLVPFDRFKAQKQYTCRDCGLKRGFDKRRFTLEYVQEYAKSRNCILLSTEYKNNAQELEFLFSCGHNGNRTFADFQTCNPVCYNCSGIRKYSLEDIEKYLSDNNYILISKEHINANSKLIFKDEKGYFYKCSFHEVDVNTRRGDKMRFVDIHNPFSLDNIKLWMNKNSKPFFILDEIYVGKDHKMKLQCTNKNCEEIFYAQWQSIYFGSGCPYCSFPAKKVGKRNNLKYKFPEIAEEWNYKKNGDLLPENILPGAQTKVWWNCLDCGYEWKTSCGSRTGSSFPGCPKCCNSKGEKQVSKILDKFEIDHRVQFRFKDCKRINQLPFDFYIPEYNTIIEYMGQQHEYAIDWFGGEESLLLVKERDKIKRDYCINNNIGYIDIWYYDFKNIEQILIQELGLTSEERRI